jgi:hypothetical protein
MWTSRYSESFPIAVGNPLLDPKWLAYHRPMKHVTFADKSLLVDDETADLLLEYAAALARSGDADAVDIHAFSSDGDEVTATLLLDAGAPLMSETTNSSLTEPDNEPAQTYMRQQLARLSPVAINPDDGKVLVNYDDLDLI